MEGKKRKSLKKIKKDSLVEIPFQPQKRLIVVSVDLSWKKKLNNNHFFPPRMLGKKDQAAKSLYLFWFLH